MARPLRLPFPGGIYHVTARGNDRQTIFEDDADCSLFLIVLASIVSAIGALLSRVGPLHLGILVLAAGFVLSVLLRGLFGAGRDLDRLLDATRRVQDGDYSVRVGRTRSGVPAMAAP